MKTFPRLTGLLLLLAVSAAFPVPAVAQPASETPAKPAPPAGKRFTIQTGTFASYGQCVRQFMELAQKIPGDALQDLRIERLEKYYVVRIGTHDRIEEAYRQLSIVKETVSDAFALNESPDTDERILYLYPGVSSTSELFTLDAARLASREQAEAVFFALKPQLEEAIRPLLRMEKEGESYAVTVGAFHTFLDIRRVQRALAAATGTWGVIRERGPGDGTEVIEVGKPPESEPSGDPVSESSYTGAGIQPFEAEAIVKPMENIDAAMNGFLDEKEYGKAIEVIKSAIDRWPDNPDLYSWYGAVYMEMDRPDKALEQYQKAAELAPGVPQYQSDVGYGYLSMQRNSTRQSIEAFNRALAIDPENADALEGLGTVYVSIGKKDLAAGIYDELKELDPQAAQRLQTLIQFGVSLE